MNTVKKILLGVILLCIAYLSYSIYLLESERRVIKEDLVELSKIKYGLFNVDEWKVIIADIIASKIDELELEDTDYDMLREDIELFLIKLIDGLEERYYADRPQTFRGVLQGGVAQLTGVFDQMRKDVPTFADEIVNFLEDPKSREAIKKFLEDQLEAYVSNTFARTDYREMESILRRNNYATKMDAATGLTLQEADLKMQQRPYTYVLIGCLAALALFLFMVRRPSRWELVLVTLSSFVLLGTGLLLPMIEIDARVQKMEFTLLGEQVAFYNQVLYFKSKSILEIVQLMLQQGKIDIILVGILVLVFSVLFPVTKLLASIVYVFRLPKKAGGFLKFLVFKTGKWSMADVMVVAIFMSYIGFSGIVSEQLRQIDGLTRAIDVVTTNESSLEIGFYLFTAFVLLSILLSHVIQYRFKGEHVIPSPAAEG